MQEIRIFVASSNELRYERLILSEFELMLNQSIPEKNIKIIMEKWEHLDSSISYLEKAASILEQLFGSENSETIAVYDITTIAYNKLALEYLQNKDWGKAEEYFLKELEIRSKNPASKEGENVEIHSLLQSVREEREADKKSKLCSLNSKSFFPNFPC